jgi:hypothetical protein
MSFGSTTISTSEPRLGALTFQNSAYGLPVPLFWGTSRLTGNLIWYGDFKATAKTTTTSSGGKGGGDVESKNTSYSYATAFMLGLCEGAVNSISTVWKDKEKTTFSALGLTLLSGTLPQSVWGHLTTNHPDEAISYPGLAVVAHSAFALGGSAYLPQMSFEVSGPRQFGSGIVDARPDEIVTDLLTHARYGAGFPSARLSLSVYRTYTQADGLFLSPMLNTQQAASQHLEEILQATNSAALWSEGLLKLIPYGDSTVIGNGTTYTPAITPQYDLTDDDFIVTGAEPPIVVRRKPSADATNQFQVEYRNRSNEYNIDIAEAKDLGCISTYGLRSADPVRLHAICEGAVADKVVNTLMQRKLYIRNEYEFRLSWRFCLLEPMDIVTLTHAPLGLSLFQVRIIEIEEDEDGLLRVIAEEFPFGVATPAAIQTQTPSGYSVDFNAAPGNANSPVIFEPPLSLSMQPEVWLATSGGSSWGGCEVWVSLDNDTYKQAGTISGPARHGTLTAILASGTDPDTTNTLAVDLSVSSGQLVSGTLVDRDLYTTLCYVDGELVSYQTATLTALHKYSLTSLRRGVHGTPLGSHAIGSKFARLDQAVFRFAYTPDYLGKTIYIKLRSFNIYGTAAQELSAITPTTYAIVGPTITNVTGLAGDPGFVGQDAAIKWDPTPDAVSYTVRVYDTATMTLRRTVSGLSDPRYIYRFADNKGDGGPWRSLTFTVQAVFITGQLSALSSIAFTNPQIVAPTGVTVTAGVQTLTVQANAATDTDYKGTVIYVGLTAGFTPGSANIVYNGPSFKTFQVTQDGGGNVLTGNTTYYLKLAHYDYLTSDSEIAAAANINLASASGTPTKQPFSDPPPAPDSLTVTPLLYANQLDWTQPASDEITETEIWGANANDWSSSILLTQTAGLKWTHTSLDPGQAWWYWIRSVNPYDKPSDTFFPPGVTDGVFSGSVMGLMQEDGTFLTTYFGEPDLMPTDIQTFSANGTFTKPASGTSVVVELWGGGGGGGGANASGSGGGGAGGHYIKRTFRIDELPATVAVTIGAAGASGATGVRGGNGGITEFGNYSQANGGGGGGAYTLDPGRGGGSAAATGGRGGLAGSGIAGGGGGTNGSIFGVGGVGDAAGTTPTASLPGHGGTGVNSGGGGGGASATYAGDGGDSTNGGAGGGGGSTTADKGGSGGISVSGGNGGEGGYASSTGTPTAGGFPGGGGGGGGGTTQAGAAGAAGYCRVSTY